MPSRPSEFTNKHPRNFWTPQEFWSCVDSSAGPESCWPWTGSMFMPVKGMPLPYGKAARRRNNVMFQSTAHRVAFEFAHGYPSKVTRHTCDNPPCCNPAHLLDGTQGDNMRDRSERGRSRNGQEKLTHDDVRAIRAEYAPRRGNGSNIEELAVKYSTTAQTIWRTATRKTYKNVI